MHRGRVVFGAMDEVVFGRPAREAIVEQLDRLGAERAFLMVSGTLNRETDEIEKVRAALGPRCVGTFDKMPAHIRARAGIVLVPEGRQVFPELTVRQNLRLGAFARKGLDLDAEIDAMFARFPRLKERINHRAGLLSAASSRCSRSRVGS